MKNKNLKSKQRTPQHDSNADNQGRKKQKLKNKYNHKSFWLLEEDDDYVAPNYKDEEE